MSKNVSFDISVDANKLIDQITSSTERGSLNSRYFDGDQGRFVSCQAGGLLIAASYHSSKKHSATCEVHNNFQQKLGAPDQVVRSAKSEGLAGEWAIAYCKSGKLGGDKTYYDLCE